MFVFDHGGVAYLQSCSSGGGGEKRNVYGLLEIFFSLLGF